MSVQEVIWDGVAIRFEDAEQAKRLQTAGLAQIHVGNAVWEPGGRMKYAHEFTKTAPVPDPAAGHVEQRKAKAKP